MATSVGRSSMNGSRQGEAGRQGNPLTVAVLVPTYRRTKELHACLSTLAVQVCPAAEIIVVIRSVDDETEAYLRSDVVPTLPMKVVTVDSPGIVTALNAGLAVVDRDIVAITDDDSTPYPDWLCRIEAHFAADASIGGVGGRDFWKEWEHAPTHAVVGVVRWWGKVVGFHHLGVGPARDVDVLKGVNMSFRRSALAGLQFDSRLRGGGAQVHNELMFSLTMRRAGWRLVYDPRVAVGHSLAPRHDIDQRDRVEPLAISDAVYNQTLALLEHLSIPRRAVFLVWSLLIGTRAAPGLAQWLRFLVIRESHPTQRLLASLRGQWDACSKCREQSTGTPQHAQRAAGAVKAPRLPIG